MEALILNYWWVVVALICAVLNKYILRFFFGMVVVPEDRIGLVTKKFVLYGPGKELPDGRIIATKGEAGFQGKTLAPGLYFGMWFWQYNVTMEEFTIIPEGKIGLILAKDGSEIPTGNILGHKVECDNFQDAVRFLENGGQRGRQTSYITSGSYRINTMLFQVSVTDMVRIQESMVGIVTTLDGLPIERDQIAGKLIEGHNNFQDFDEFINRGGNRGLQPQVVLAGSYNLNPWAIQLEQIPMTEIAIGYVGVVISYIGNDGNDLTGADFKHGNIVAKGSKGVWVEPLGPGKYPINKYVMKVEPVPTTNLVLNWASARSEAHNLDKNLCTITVRSKDGFPFNLDVSQIIHVPTTEAPKVIARFGNMVNLVSQVLEPTIGNYFRNSAQDSDVIAFLSTRKERQESAKEHIRKVLDEYNVNAVDTLIGDIVPPESLMKTLTDRKLPKSKR
ncbi:SPFH domain-containing protein [Pedobacter sp. JY14-1]|uniref:SPFH domain-containing protein n=1 Tax=Pedobacter sp. JY14-1 TaxID=3034151 RepID=UPI0023E31751|nr:SPFH domain-containing protein [Pedobacter sp. JY14-1]